MNNNLSIDLSDLNIADVQVLEQDGKGLPEFAASSSFICIFQCSCVVEEEDKIAE
ncbi:MAG: hypothetical protein AAF368_03810 [Planctomycetota bacterium]